MPLSSPLIVIPARMGSTRLPGKPLADINGVPMIVHVWRRAVEAEMGPVIVACAESEIVAAIEQAGGKALLTRPDHPSGSDRIHEAVTLLDPARRHDVIVNLQGDLPTLDPAAVAAVLSPLADSGVDIATLASPMREAWERESQAAVKVAVGFAPGARIARALYFSSNLIPRNLNARPRRFVPHSTRWVTSRLMIRTSSPWMSSCPTMEIMRLY